jgi:putative lipoic acid-binding regulatory protein
MVKDRKTTDAVSQETSQELLQETLIEFPCNFPIKVMGETHAEFTSEIIKAIQSVLLNFDASSIEMRGSSGGKYISLTCTVHVTSKPQLDDVYRALTSHPMVKVTL